MSFAGPFDPRSRKVLLGVVAALVVFSRLGHGHLANFDDCYYAEKAKEMIQTGDWLTPHFAGLVRLDNPPLFLWIVAGGLRVFGIGDYGASFFPALSAVLCVLLVVRLARRLGLDDFEAWSAGVVLLTTQYFLKYAQHAMMDVTLTLFFLLAIDGYLSGVEGRRSGYVQLGLATGLGVLMKSVLGLFPLIVVALHRTFARRFLVLTESGLWIAGFVTLLVAAPWFAYQLSAHGAQLLDEHFRWLIVSRGFVEPSPSGTGNDPFGYVLRIGTVYWPWLPFALAGIWLESACLTRASRDAKERSRAALLLLWPSVVIGTMSLGHAKKLWYVMSVFPCLALLSARAIGRILRSDAARRRGASWTTAVLVSFAGVVALTPLGAARPREPGLQQLTRVVRASVPAGQKILNLDTPYWEIANQWLFYSEHDLTEPIHDPDRLREGLRRGGWALIDTARVADVVGQDEAAYAIAARSGPWALVTAAPPPAIVLPPIEPAR